MKCARRPTDPRSTPAIRRTSPGGFLGSAHHRVSPSSASFSRRRPRGSGRGGRSSGACAGFGYRVRGLPERAEGARRLGGHRRAERTGGDRRSRRRLDRRRRRRRGPGGAAEWLQVGLAVVFSGSSVRLYYELTVPGKDTKYVELEANVAPGEKHERRGVEISKRNSWWRVWVDTSRRARRSSCRRATERGTRRRSPRTGTAAPAPATRTRTGSRTCASRTRTAGRGSR